MDRRLFLHIHGGRQISGVLRGFDMFLNLVVDQAFEELGAGQRKPCGMVVSREWSQRCACGIRRVSEGVSGDRIGRTGLSAGLGVIRNQ